MDCAASVDHENGEVALLHHSNVVFACLFSKAVCIPPKYILHCEAMQYKCHDRP